MSQRSWKWIAPSHLAAAIALAIPLGLAGDAAALTITTNPVVINPGATPGTAVGTITLIDVVVGQPVNSQILNGGPLDNTFVSLVFELAVNLAVNATAGSVQAVGVGAVQGFTGIHPAAAGVINSTGDVAVSSVTVSSQARIFNFASPWVGDGETGQRFFISYKIGNLAVDGSHNLVFMIDPEVGGLFNETVTVIPEPGTALLLGGGLLGLLGASRRLGRRA